LKFPPLIKVAIPVFEAVTVPLAVIGVPKVTTPPPPPPTPAQWIGFCTALADAVGLKAARVPAGRASARTPMRIL
jgi:hypothetical protein